MTPKPVVSLPHRLADIAAAIVVMAAVVLLVGMSISRANEPAVHPTPIREGPVAEPIASEANVFRTKQAELGVMPTFQGDSSAHVRSLDMYRRLRAYPGAPPRVPHGLTGEEYRGLGCMVCHLRGGWVARFSAYAPVTPHPEQSSCLQCHVPQDGLVGRPLPSRGDSIACLQCHIDPDAPPEIFVELDWETVPWPETDLQAMPESPNRIPHSFQTRNNCLACHAGPGAVVDLRTDHPERVNCRQCHVQLSEDVGVRSRGPDGSAGLTGGSP